jgi:hypothetical protein
MIRLPFAKILLIALLGVGCLNVFAQSIVDGREVDGGRALRLQAARGYRGTYCRPPLLPNGRTDVQKLVDQLVEIHANTYCFCIHGNTNQWDDLQLFLPLARKAGIRVWGSVVPPSESPPRSHAYAEPFRLDYERWAVEFAKLSLRETNLIAWSIDDFTHNLKIYTPEQVKKMLDAARVIHPHFAFVPCCYYSAVTPEFVKNYMPLLDGFLFPYRHESGGANLKDADLVGAEIKKIKEMTGPDFPVILDIYATRHSRLGDSTPEYVEQVMITGKPVADGVMIYCHQDPKTSAQKYQLIKRVFADWAK